MTTYLEIVYYVAALVLVLWLFLLAATRSQRKTLSFKLGLGGAAVLAAFLPLNGLPLWRVVFAMWGNPSIPLCALVASSVIQHLWGVTLLAARERLALWFFGAVMGSVLYFHTHLPGGLDLYFAGWDRPVFTLSLVGVTILLLARGSRLGVVGLLAVIASALGGLESSNSWDYVVDPFFWLIGVGIGLKAAVKRGRRSVAPKAETESIQAVR
jgi:hypothetical protein